jgi:hypothetical protein
VYEWWGSSYQENFDALLGKGNVQAPHFSIGVPSRSYLGIGTTLDHSQRGLTAM